MKKGFSNISNPIKINSQLLENNKGTISSAPTIESGLSSARCKCCFQSGISWFCYLDQSQIDFLPPIQVPQLWGLPQFNNDQPVQPICVDMDGSKGSISQTPGVPLFHKMTYIHQGKLYSSDGGRNETPTFSISNLSNEDKYPYTLSSDVAGFQFPEFSVSQARKIPTTTADTLCGPVICLSGSPEPIGFSYDRMNYNWYFGQNAAIDFRPIITGGTMVPLVGPLISQEGCATISTAEGKTLFYTNGETVYTSGGTIMINGTGLASSGTSTQSVIIVPQPDNNRYFIFTTDFNGNPNGFEYSLVNMSLQGGDGQVSSKNNQLISGNVSEKVTACCHGNEDAYWVITHTSGDSTFYSYKISSSGIENPLTPITTSIGSIHNTARGYMKTSPNGEKLISLLYDEDIIDIFDFDNTGGTLSNFVTLTGFTYDIGPYGLEFSSDSSKFYVSEGAGDKIYQFDLSYSGAVDILDNYIQLPTISGISGTTLSGTSLGALQMGPDEKIYIADRFKPYLHRIHYPNGLGINCNLQQQDFSLTSSTVTGVTSQWGLPNVITCKALSCDRFVYVSQANRLGYMFDFVFNNVDKILQDPYKKLSFIGEFYPRVPNTRTFSRSAEYTFTIEHDTLKKRNTHTQIIPTRSFLPGEHIIRGYWKYGLETFVANQMGWTRSTLNNLPHRGKLYDMYDPPRDWYYIGIPEASQIIFNSSTPQPPGSTAKLVVQSQFTEEGRTDYNVNTLGSTLVALGGNVLSVNLEYSAITSGVTPYIKLLFEPEPHMALTFAFIEGGTPSSLFADLYTLPYDPKSGPLDGQGSERVWNDTTTGYQEFFLQGTPASNVLLVLNGSPLMIDVEYWMSSSNPRRVIFASEKSDGTPLVLHATNILQAFYEVREPALGKMKSATFELPFYILRPPTTLDGKFIVEFAENENFDNILYRFETSYKLDTTAYIVEVDLKDAKAGDKFFWRIINLYWYEPLIGNTICSYIIGNPYQIEIETNLNDAY